MKKDRSGLKPYYKKVTNKSKAGIVYTRIVKAV